MDSLKSNDVTLIVADNPFSSEKKIIQVERKSFRELFDENTRGKYPIGQAIFIDKDERVTDLDSIPKTDSVIIKIIPEGSSPEEVGKNTAIAGFAIAAIGFIVAGFFPPLGIAMIKIGGAMFLGGLATMIYSHFLDDSLDARKRNPPDRQKSIRGSRNRVNIGGRVPIFLGRHLIYPDFVGMPYIKAETSGDAQIVHQLFAVGYEEVKVTSANFKLGDTLVSSYGSDVQSEIHEGTTPQHTLYPRRVFPTYPQTQIFTHNSEDPPEYSEFVTTSSSNTADIEIGFTFPAGLIHYNDDGDKKPTSVLIKIEISPIEDLEDIYYASYTAGKGKRVPSYSVTGSTDISVGDGSGSTITFSGEQVNPKRKVFYFKLGEVAELWNASPSKTFQIKIYASDLPKDRRYWTRDIYIEKINYWIFEGDDHTVESNRHAITEDIKDKLTTIALTAKSAESLQGVLDQFNMVAELETYDYDSSAIGSDFAKWENNIIKTRNPASMFLYLLVNPKINRHWQKNLNRVDWPSLVEWWEFCDAGGSSNTGKMECNIVISDDVLMEDALSLVASTGRASWTIIDGKIRIIIDKKKDFITQYFTPKNSYNFVGTKVFNELHDVAKVSFISEEVWQEEEIDIYRDLVNPTDENPTEIKLHGVTNPLEAAKMGRYILANESLRPEMFQFETDIENIVCMMGDRIQISHDVPLIGIGIATRIIGGIKDGENYTHLEVDEEIIFEAEKEYGIVLRPILITEEDGTDSNIIRLNIETPLTLTNRILDGEEVKYLFELSTPIPESKIVFNMLCMPGERGEETLDLLIQTITTSSGFNAEITAIPYSPEVFDAEDGDIASYVPTINKPPQGLTSPNVSGVYEPAKQLAELNELARDSLSRVTFGQAVEGFYFDQEGEPITELDPVSLAMTSQGRTVSMAITNPLNIIGSSYRNELQISDDNTTWYSINNPGKDPEQDAVNWSTSWRDALNAVTVVYGFEYVHSKVPFGGTPEIPVPKTYYYRVRAVLGIADPMYSPWSGFSIEIRPLSVIDFAQGTISAIKIDVEDLFAENIAVTGSLQVGTGSNLAGIIDGSLGTDVVIWAGSTLANRATAPYRVTAAGNLVATNATITGTITATSGQIANFNIGINELSTGTFDTLNTLYFGTGGLSLSNTFKVTAAGALTAVSGNIGGFTLSTNSLIAGSGATRVSLSTAQGIHLGHDTFASAPFRVTPAGTLTATSGTIGGFTIEDDRLYSIKSGTARVQLDDSETRFAIYDAFDAVKVALGYLGNISGFTSDEYGLYIAPGNKVRIEGGGEFVDGSFKIEHDAFYGVFDDGGNERGRFGSLGGGDVGFRIGSPDLVDNTPGIEYSQSLGELKIAGTLAANIVKAPMIDATALDFPQDAVAYWPFDDGEGDTVKEVKNGYDGTLVGFGPVAEYHFDGDLTDSSGNDNNASTPGTTGYVTGKVGQAIDLDQTSADIDLPAAVYEVFDSTGPWAVGCWVKLATLDPEPILTRLLSVPSTVGDIRLSYDQRTHEFRGGIYDGTSYYLAYSGDDTASTDWMHVLLTFDGSNIKIYLNASEYDDRAYGGGTVTPTGGAIKETLEALVDDYRVYDYVPSQAEISALYNRPQKPSHWVDGPAGGALNFPQTSTVPGSATADGQAKFPYPKQQISAERTLSCWVRIRDIGIGSLLLRYHTSGNWGIARENTVIRFGARWVAQTVQVSFVPVINEWEHWVLIITKAVGETDGVVRVYRNSELSFEFYHSNSEPLDSGNDDLIANGRGRLGGTNADSYTGDFDLADPRIYPRALSAAEVKTLYQFKREGTGLVRTDNLVAGAVTADKIDVVDLIATGNIIVTGDNVSTLNNDSDYQDGTDVSGSINAFSGTLGELAFKSLVGEAELGDTIISGGYLQTSLINVTQLFAQDVVIGQQIRAGFTANGDQLEPNKTAGFWLSATGKLKAENAELMGTIRTGPGASHTARVAIQDEVGITEGPNFTGTGANDLLILGDGVVVGTFDVEITGDDGLVIGDTGPAGGVVFRIDTTTTPHTVYEAWTEDEPGTYQWKTSETDTPGTSTDIGTGYDNTYTAMNDADHPAAVQARAASHGGFDDWFLPSKDELNQMYIQKDTIGGFASALYWSSSQGGTYLAWCQDFSTGSQFGTNKDLDFRVRVVRSFAQQYDKFKWRQGANAFSADIEMTDTNLPLLLNDGTNYGITITFINFTGHNVGDSWYFEQGEMRGLSIKDSDDNEFFEAFGGQVNITGSLSAASATISGNLSVTGKAIFPSVIAEHTGDANTYIQFHANDQWRVVTGGVERLEVNNSAVTVVGALSAASATLTGALSAASATISGDATILNLETTGSPSIRFDMGGNATTGTYRIHSWGSSRVLSLEAMGDVQVVIDENNNQTSKAFVVRHNGTSGAQLLRVQENGNVGIGTTSPGYPLHIAGAQHHHLQLEGTGGAHDAWIRFVSDRTGTDNWQIGAGAAGLRFYSLTGNADRMVIQTGGNVGIGTTNPTPKLHVLDSANIATDQDSTASGDYSANVASIDCTASGLEGELPAAMANVACWDCDARGHRSVNAASSGCITSASRSVNMASALSVCGESNTQNTVVVASTRVLNNVPHSLALGYAASGSASTANRTIHLFSNGGNVSIEGSLTESATFTDFAEMFANNEAEAIPAGTILTHDGGGVKIAQDGDEIAGVVSYTAAVLAGDTPFCWQGRYLHDEFGRRLYEDIPDPDYEGEGEAPIISVLKENPEWDPTQEQVSRSDRPDEWTPAGLLGQVYVMVGQDVVSGDRLKPINGIGVKSTEKTGLRCMAITQEYTQETGYAIARCMINVTV